MTNYVSKFLIMNGKIRLYVLNAVQNSRIVCKTENNTYTKRQLLNALNVSTLYCAMNNNNERVSLRFISKDQKSKISIDIFSNKTLTGFFSGVENNSLRGGLLHYMKKTGGKYSTNYTSITELEGDDIYNEMSHFFKYSEQLDTFFLPIKTDDYFSNSVILLQLLPFTEIEDINYCFERITAKANQNDFSSLKNSEIFLSQEFKDVKFLECLEISYSCVCIKEMFIGVVLSLTENEIKDIILKNESLYATCNMCSKEYIFSANEIKNITNTIL